MSLSLGAASAWADYRETYDKGVEAAAKGNWTETARLMRAALVEQPSEAEPVPADGRRFEGYLPYYYLGLALFNTGDCQGAVRAWDASRRQTAVRRSPHFKKLRRLEQDCRKHLARESEATHKASAAAEEIAKAERLAHAVSGLESKPDLSARQREALGRGLREARARLADARSRLDAGRRTAALDELAKARELAQGTTELLDKVRQRATRPDAAPAAESSLAEDAAARPESPAPAPATASAGPPAEIVNAARAYFGGRYADALAVLADVRYDSGPAALQSRLLRAAARHALYVIGGRQDQGLLQALSADIQAVRRLDPSFQPDPEAFSPRFRNLFH